MNLKPFTDRLSKLQRIDRPRSVGLRAQPCIALIHGFAGREHMQLNLLRYLRQMSYSNTTLYGHLQADLIADELQAAAETGQQIVIIGYSQGGLEAVRVARELQQRGVAIALLVTIAAGGRGGRFWPHRWQDDPRQIPPNVVRCLNYFSVTDFLGTDQPLDKNLAFATDPAQHIDNIRFDREDGVSHLAISQSYPIRRVHPKVDTLLLQRLSLELSELLHA